MSLILILIPLLPLLAVFFSLVPAGNFFAPAATILA
jgi:hypothetical protein